MRIHRHRVIRLALIIWPTRNGTTRKDILELLLAHLLLPLLPPLALLTPNSSRQLASSRNLTSSNNSRHRKASSQPKTDNSHSQVALSVLVFKTRPRLSFSRFRHRL